MGNNKTPRRDLLNELGLEESIVFENPDYDSAIIGYDANDSRVVYDYESMAEHLMNVDGMTYEEAIEFIEYNTLRAIPYAGSNPPIVLQRINDYMDYHNYEKEEKTIFNPEDFVNKCVAWIKKWFENNGPKCKAVIGVSGGKDSTVCLALLVQALGAENVIGVAMPDTNQGVNDADKICEYFGVKYLNMPINGMTEAFSRMWYYVGDEDFKWTKQSLMNIPPRIRMTMLYAIAQTYNGRVAGTCNASELYVGYATRYGDMASDFEPIASITCRQVVEVGHYLGIPKEWVDKVPDDGLPGSETDDSKFSKWGFSYKTLDDFIENGTSNDSNIDNSIKNKHNETKFKLNLGEIFSY